MTADEHRRRLKSLLVHPNAVLRLFVGGDESVWVSCSGLPEDATLAGCDIEGERGMIRLFVHSATFPVVPDGEQPPSLIAGFTFVSHTEREMRAVPMDGPPATGVRRVLRAHSRRGRR